MTPGNALTRTRQVHVYPAEVKFSCDPVKVIGKRVLVTGRAKGMALYLIFRVKKLHSPDPFAGGVS